MKDQVEMNLDFQAHFLEARVQQICQIQVIERGLRNVKGLQHQPELTEESITPIITLDTFKISLFDQLFINQQLCIYSFYGISRK